MRSSRPAVSDPVAPRVASSAAALPRSPASHAMKTRRSSASSTPEGSSRVGSGPSGRASFPPVRSSTWKGIGAACDPRKARSPRRAIGTLPRRWSCDPVPSTESYGRSIGPHGPSGTGSAAGAAAASASTSPMVSARSAWQRIASTATSGAEDRRQGGRGQRCPPRRLDLRRAQGGEHPLRGDEGGLGARLARRVRERAVEARVGKPGKAIAHLLPCAPELLGREAGRRLATRSLDRLAQPSIIVARRAGRDDGHCPVRSLLDAGAQVVAEAQALADLLEEPRVGIGTHDLDRHREREHVPRRGRRGRETDQIGLREVGAAEPDEPGGTVAGAREPGRTKVAAAGKGPTAGASHRAERDSADDGDHHVRDAEVPCDEAPYGFARHAPDARDRAAHRMAERAVEEVSPRLLVHVVARVLLAAADLVDHHPLLLREAVRGYGAAEALLGEEGQGLLDVVVEDLEVERDVLVAGVGVVLAAELAGAAVERRLIEATRALEEHVLGHVGDAGMGAVEARPRTDDESDRGERTGHRVVEEREDAVTQTTGLAKTCGHTLS